MVTTQAMTMLWATFQRTAETRRAAPTPTIAPVIVCVVLLEFRHQLPDWREKAQRQGAWLLADEAANLVDEPGLIQIVQGLSRRPTSKGKPPSRKVRPAS